MYNIYCESKSGIVLIAPSFDGEQHLYNLDGPTDIRISKDGALEITGQVTRMDREKCNEWYRYHHITSPVEKAAKEEWDNGPATLDIEPRLVFNKF